MIKHSLIYMVSNILNAIIPFLLLPILTRYLNPTEYGYVAMFELSAIAFGALVGFNVHGAASVKFYEKNSSNHELKCFIGACMQIVFFSMLLVGLVVYCFSDFFIKITGISEKWLFLSILCSAFTFIHFVRLGLWQVHRQPIHYGIFQVNKSILNLLLSLLLVIVFAEGASGRIDAQLISFGLFAALAIYQLYKDKLIILFTWRPDLIKEALAFGIPLIPHTIGAILLSFADRFFINAQLGLAQAGIYMAAFQISMGAILIFDAINKAYTPWLFENLTKNESQVKKVIVKKTYIFFLSIICLMTISAMIAPYLIPIILGQSFQSSSQLVGILILGQTFGGLYYFVTNYIFYTKKTKFLAMSTFMSGMINILLLIIMLPQYGLVGAAYAFLISKLTHFIVTWYVANKVLPMPWFTKIKT